MNLLPVPLPLVGDAHPLRICYRRYLTRSIVGAVLLHISIVTAWILPRTDEVVIEEAIEFTKNVIIQPPPIDPNTDRGPVSIRDIVKSIAVGLPIPVQDWIAPEDLEFADQEQLSIALGAADQDLIDCVSGGPIVWEPPVAEKEQLPEPGEFVAFEAKPVIIMMPAPVYPDMARRAGVEGTVMLRVLVGKDGHVLDAIVTNGIPMLDDAALAAAKRALFRPALQQNRPIAVWVQIPMRFVLN